MPLIVKRAVYLCAGAILIFAGSLSGDEGRRWNVERFAKDTEAVYKAAAEVNAGPGIDVVVLDDEKSYVAEADGKSVFTSYLVYRVLNEQGAKDWGSISADWSPWLGSRPQIRVRVITPDYVAHALDEKTVTEAATGDSDDSTYTNRREVKAPLPAVAPGSLVEREVIWNDTEVLAGAGTVQRVYVGRTGVPVQNLRIVVDYPTALPVQYEVQLVPDLKPERKEENGRVRLTFDAGPLEPMESGYANLPSEVPAYPHITFSTGKSWQRLAEQYAATVDAQIKTTDVKQLTGKLIAGKNSREEKAEAILQYLDTKIRYTGVEFDEAAIVPRPPAETLKREYGDCKDKSTLLVAMLRSAGIDSYVALLDAGEREDVPVSLPGMGLFDHAIVYAPGTPDLWIDATAQYMRLGNLPSASQGRLALVARSESNGLITTPVASSHDELLNERREIDLQENGPAKIVETSVPHGTIEADYRSAYADAENKDRREELTGYMKNQYLAATLDRVERSDPGDISKQFALVLETKTAKRGATDLNSAVAAIRLEGIFSRLPGDLQQREKDDEGKKAAGEKPKKARTADYQLPSAFVTRWEYKIVPPPGFQSKPLPQNQKVELGPAKLTEEFSSDKDGNVEATIEFDTVKRRFTVAEATEMRNKVAELREGEATLVNFEPMGQALLREGKVRESFQAYRDLIKAHPKDAVFQLQYSQALLSAGMGQAARDEARSAVHLQPDSALAQKTLGEVLEYDLVGRKFRSGSDYDGAESAFRTAKTLDPEDDAGKGNLAILLEYDKEGERYGDVARLEKAIVEYREITPEHLSGIGLKNNPAFALLYARKFAEAKAYAENLNPRLNSVIIAAEAAQNGPKAGIAEASKIAGNEDQQKQLLKSAGEILMRTRQYPEAADLFEAGASGDNASNTMGLAAMLRKARHHEDLKFADDAEGSAMRVMLLAVRPKFEMAEMLAVSSRNAREITKRMNKEELEHAMKQGGSLRRQLASSGFPPDVLFDVMMQSMEVKSEGTDATGYRVTMRPAGHSAITMFVVKEDGAYKMLDDANEPNAIGLEILDRIAANDLTGARAYLDWLREDQHLGGGDDPLVGQAFPRMWAKGQVADAVHMRMAAAAILVQTRPTAEQGVTILEELKSAAANDAEKINISLALTTGYRFLDEFEKVRLLTSEMGKQHPESLRNFQDEEYALRGLRRFQDADVLAQDRLKRLPDDLEAQRALIFSAVGREDFELAHELSLRLANSGKAEAGDYGRVAWLSLFTGKTQQVDVENATKAVQLSQSKTASDLHTLGCVYAEIGKTKEAREVLIQGMDILNLDEPNSDYWYGLGRIAEQYGEMDVAKSDYARVTKPEKEMNLNESSYHLAQTRLKVLEAAAGSKSAGMVEVGHEPIGASK